MALAIAAAGDVGLVEVDDLDEDVVIEDLEALWLGGEVVWLLLARRRCTGDGEGWENLSLEDEARLRLSSSYVAEPDRSSRVFPSSPDFDDSSLSRSSSPLGKINIFQKNLYMLAAYKKSTYLILSMMYLSGMSPSWPRTAPFHQSLDTCLNKVTVSPL
jgi:hypothetical protein